MEESSELPWYELAEPMIVPHRQAILSLLLGVASLTICIHGFIAPDTRGVVFLGLPCSVAAVVLGRMASRSAARDKAKIGMALGILGCVACTALLAFMLGRLIAYGGLG